MKSVFTTGEAAEICKVSQQTIIRCFDSGRLKGFRVPGSRFRRIPREALMQFMKDNGIPPDSIDSGKTKVLIIIKPGLDDLLQTLIHKKLTPADLADVRRICCGGGIDTLALRQGHRHRSLRAIIFRCEIAGAEHRGCSKCEQCGLGLFHSLQAP
jgi:excisionase family DNA binding protein